MFQVIAEKAVVSFLDARSRFHCIVFLALSLPAI